MKKVKIESRYVKVYNEIRAAIMYEGCFLQTRLSKTLDVSADQKIRPSICFKTCF